MVEESASHSAIVRDVSQNNDSPNITVRDKCQSPKVTMCYKGVCLEMVTEDPQVTAVGEGGGV